MADNLEMGMRGQFILDMQAERNKEKESLREKIDKATATFIKNGGEVQELPGVGNIPKQPYKKLEPYPSRPKLTPYADFKYNAMLRDWCDETIGRLKELSRRTGYTESWLRYRCSGRYQFRFVDYEQVKPFMDDIEQMEKDLKLKIITRKYTGTQHEEKN